MAPELGWTKTCVYLPQRLELSFLSVFAFPNDSRMGFDRSTASSNARDAPPARVVLLGSWRFLLRYDRYLRIYLHVSVLPEPDSPEMTKDWDDRSRSNARSAASASKYLRDQTSRDEGRRR